MRPRHWRLLVAVVVALAWLMQPAWSASQSASAGVPDPQNIEPTSGPPGTVSVLERDPCRAEEPALVWFREGEAVGQDPALPYVASTELRQADGGQISFVVPDLPAGSYELVASCEPSGPATQATWVGGAGPSTVAVTSSMGTAHSLPVTFR